MTEPVQDHVRPFSLVQGGPIYRALHRLRVVRSADAGTGSRAALAVAVTFAPLVVFTAMGGVLFGTAVDVPLVADWSVLVRFLFALPMLLAAEVSIDRRLAGAVETFRTSGVVVGAARADLDSSIQKVTRSRDSMVPELVLLVGAFAFAWIGSRATLGLPVSSWRALTPGLESTATLAGRWLTLVSLPFFNFLMLRWLWRIFLWSRFLHRVSRIDLKLVPTHPDRAGGLAFLGMAHTAFAAFLVPVAASVAARGVQWVQYGGGTLEGLRNALVLFGVFALAITLGPLLVFLPRMLAAKRQGLEEYGQLASEYTRGFDRKWLRGGDQGGEPLLGTADIQSLADLGNSYAVIQDMRPMPASLRHAVSLALAVALPMLPLLAIVLPLEKVFMQLLQLVL